MKTHKFTLLIVLIGILTLIALSQTQPIQTGIIKSIQPSQFKITIHLENHSAELIIFDSPSLNFKPGDKIKFQGKPDIYKNQKQIIIKKISKIQPTS